MENAPTTLAVDSASTNEIVDELVRLQAALIEDMTPYVFTAYIRSEDGLQTYSGNYSTSEFQIALKEPLIAPDDYHFTVSVRHLSIPYSFYQINQTNQTIRYLLNATPFQINIPDGTEVNGTNFASTLQTTLNNMNGVVGTEFTVNFDSRTLRLSITRNPGASVNSYTILWPSSSARQICGFLTNGNVTFPAIVSTTDDASSAIDLLPIDTLHVRSDLIDSNSFQSSTSGQSNELEQVNVSLETVFGSQLLEEGHDHEHVLSQREISVMNFQLTDTNDSLVGLNGLNWHFVLIFRMRPKPVSRRRDYEGRGEIDFMRESRIKSEVAMSEQEQSLLRQREVLERTNIVLAGIQKRLLQSTLTSPAQQQNQEQIENI